MRLRARKRERMTETLRVMERARKNWPTTPERRPRGANTTTEVRVEPTTGASSSLVAFSIAFSSFRARWRWMFSTTTTASSMTRPMATARPPIDIRFTVSPNRRMKRNVEMTVRGRVSAARPPNCPGFPRPPKRAKEEEGGGGGGGRGGGAPRGEARGGEKHKRHDGGGAPPMTIASRTLDIASATKPARS